MRLLEPLRIRDFALLWTGMTVSIIGDGIYLVAIPFQVLQLSNDATALSIVGAAWTIPQVVFLLMGGVIADRMDRRLVLVGADLVRGAAIAAMGMLSLAGTLELWHIYVLAAVYGTGEAFFMPAFGAIVPDIVPENLLVEANSLDQFVRPLAFRLAGPALGAGIIAVWGIGGALVADAATFAISAIAVIAIRTRLTVDPEAGGTSFVREVRQGFNYVKSQSWLWGGLTATAVGLLAFFGPWQVIVPYLVKNEMGGDAKDFALVLAAGGVGSIIVSAIVGQRGMGRRPMFLVFVVWGIATLSMAGFAIADAPWQAMGVAFVMFSLLTAGQIVWATVQHQRVPRRLLGRVSSLDWLVSTSLVPLSFAITGPLTNSLGPDTALVVASVVGGVGMLAFLFMPGIHRAQQPIGRDKERLAQAEI